MTSPGFAVCTLSFHVKAAKEESEEAKEEEEGGEGEEGEETKEAGWDHLSIRLGPEVAQVNPGYILVTNSQDTQARMWPGPQIL